LLKLVVGVTLCNEEASNVFSDQELMATMGTTIVSTWNRKAYGLSEEEGQAAGMVLQVTTVAMMNIVGSSRLARQSFIGLVDSDDDCLAGMVEVFNDREESSSQAASLEDTTENIPLGFLTWVLGYLCQEPSVKEHIVSHLPAKRISSLRLFITNFFSMMKSVDEMSEREPARAAQDTEQLKSLEAMIKQL